LIQRMSVENPLWGAPRIHGELLKLGFEVTYRGDTINSRRLDRLAEAAPQLGMTVATGGRGNVRVRALPYSQHFSPNRSAGRRDGTGAVTRRPRPFNPQLQLVRWRSRTKA